MNFPSQIFFNDINHGYRATILKKIFFVAAFILYGCGYLFPLWKGAQLQLYQTFLKENVRHFLKIVNLFVMR